MEAEQRSEDSACDKPRLPEPLILLKVQAPAQAEFVERRLAARQEVDSPIDVLLVNVGSKLAGRLLDIGLGGCKAKFENRFPVGIYTRIETEFWLNGEPFRIGGVVQDIPDKRTICIRFLDLSPRKRDMLEQVMAEIAKAAEAQQAAEH